MFGIFLAMTLLVTVVFLTPFASATQAPYFFAAIIILLVVLMLTIFFSIKKDYEEIGKD